MPAGQLVVSTTIASIGAITTKVTVELMRSMIAKRAAPVQHLRVSIQPSVESPTSQRRRRGSGSAPRRGCRAARAGRARRPSSPACCAAAAPRDGSEDVEQHPAEVEQADSGRPRRRTRRDQAPDVEAGRVVAAQRVEDRPGDQAGRQRPGVEVADSRSRRWRRTSAGWRAIDARARAARFRRAAHASASSTPARSSPANTRARVGRQRRALGRLHHAAGSRIRCGRRGARSRACGR